MRYKKKQIVRFFKYYLPQGKMRVLAILLVLSLTFITYHNTLDKARLDAGKDLSLLLELRQAHLQNYFSSTMLDLNFWGQHGELHLAIEELDFAWRKNKGEIKQAYLEDNPYPREQREKLYMANTGDNYDRFHDIVHRMLKPLTERDLGYYDIMVINKDKDVIYSVKKNGDYGRSLDTIESPKNTFVRLSDQLNSRKIYYLSDAVDYSLANYRRLLFAARNIYHLDGGWLGILVFAIPLEKIEQIMNFRDDIAIDTYSYIVGDDFCLRTLPDTSSFPDAPLFKGWNILEDTLEIEAVKFALSGREGTVQRTVQRQDLLTAYSFFRQNSEQSEHWHFKWALIAEKPINEIYKPSSQLFFIVFFKITIVFILAFILSRLVNRWLKDIL